MAWSSFGLLDRPTKIWIGLDQLPVDNPHNGPTHALHMTLAEQTLDESALHSTTPSRSRSREPWAIGMAKQSLGSSIKDRSLPLNTPIIEQ